MMHNVEMNFHIVTIFPKSFDSYLGESLLSKARAKGLISISFYNPIDFSEANILVNSDTSKVPTYSDRRVDDRPYGGGPGMVMEALPVIRAIENALEKVKDRKKTKIIFFSPSGAELNTEKADKLSNSKKITDIVMICGRYEGIDSRVRKVYKMEEISVGPYVLTGGELPAMILIDTISRRIKGVIGDINSLEDKRVASPDMYTRPEVIEWKGKKYRVPKILLGGNHKLIEEWRAGKRDTKNAKKTFKKIR